MVERVECIVPRPRELRPLPGEFTIRPTTAIVADRSSADAARLLQDWLSAAMGFRLSVTDKLAEQDCIELSLQPADASLGDEGYSLYVSLKKVRIAAATTAGLIWGIQTLRQLLPPEAFAPAPQRNIDWKVPCVSISDAPRFRWRGMLLDPARHFIPVESMLKWIDLLSLHKFNVLQWHLTDDQGWRIEIRKYPKLTEVGSKRKETLVGVKTDDNHTYDGKPHEGHYSQAEIKAIVDFAQRRGITIVPEVDIPGHSQAAIAAYPQLGCVDAPLEVWTRWGVSPNILNAEDSTVSFFQDVFSEVMSLFPSTYIAVGGDEAIKDQWIASPRMQARIQELRLRDEEALQGWFIGRINNCLASNGRRLIGWDGILEGGLPPNATVISWQSEEAGIISARAGHDVVMAPHEKVYLNYQQSSKLEGKIVTPTWCVLPLQTVYEYEPVPESLDSRQAKYILGAQGALWSEYIPDPQTAEFMGFPRICALAEILWSARQCRSFKQFKSHLLAHVRRLKFADVNVCPIWD